MSHFVGRPFKKKEAFKVSPVSITVSDHSRVVRFFWEKMLRTSRVINVDISERLFNDHMLKKPIKEDLWVINEGFLS